MRQVIYCNRCTAYLCQVRFLQNYSMAQYIIEHGNTDQLLKEITEAAVCHEISSIKNGQSE